MMPAKRLWSYSLLRCFQYHGDRSSSPLLTGFHLFSTTGSVNRGELPPPILSVVEYLVSSCGFSRGDAVKVSAAIPHVKTTKNADTVVQFLRHKGLGEDNIRRAVLRHPHLLCVRVGKTLKPKVGILEEAGFSSADIVQLISTNAGFLDIGHLEAKIDFWRKILGSTKWTLRVISTTSILTSSIDKKIKPNISLLRETGLAEHRVRRIIFRRPRMITCRTEKVRSLIEQVRNLGISAKSGMFEHAIYALADNSKTRFNVKMSLFKGFGWSEDDFLSALRRYPHLIALSETKIREAMEFLAGEVGCEPSYVALRPVLLTYSLKKRLMPRYSVLKNLKSKGLPAGQNDYLGVIVLPEKSFMERYVLPYCEKVPGLLEAYSTAIDK